MTILLCFSVLTGDPPDNSGFTGALASFLSCVLSDEIPWGGRLCDYGGLGSLFNSKIILIFQLRPQWWWVRSIFSSRRSIFHLVGKSKNFCSETFMWEEICKTSFLCFDEDLSFKIEFSPSISLCLMSLLGFFDAFWSSFSRSWAFRVLASMWSDKKEKKGRRKAMRRTPHWFFAFLGQKSEVLRDASRRITHFAQSASFGHMRRSPHNPHKPQHKTPQELPIAHVLQAINT